MGLTGGCMCGAVRYELKSAPFDPGDDLPRHEKFRPDTRRLEGTEPPE